MVIALPLTPFHVVPASPIYFLFFNRLNGLAFFFGTLLIDLEPVAYLIFGLRYPSVQLLSGDLARQGPHMVTHNPFSVILLVAPAMVLLAKFAEWLLRSLLHPSSLNIEWLEYSWKSTYFSALLGAFLHLAWDLTMHGDINLAFPFFDVSNPFISMQAFYIVFTASIVAILPAYFIGKRLNSGSPFRKLP